MKLTEQEFPESSEAFEGKSFSIDNLGMIFDVLRNKMYSNPILAVCREYTCNARDAHREVGTPDLPIEVHFPTEQESYYKVKDFGPGISPDRMENVFIKYTASTKRNDNVQTGGMGLGSKTGFSYSNSFTIITTVDKIKYNYLCFIDETRVGKLSLLSSAPTLDPNGTEIIIPVEKSEDRIRFIDQTSFSTQHWDVKPKFNKYPCYINSVTLMSGADWKMCDTNHHGKNLIAVVDGIEYPINTKSVHTPESIEFCNQDIFLTFDVGELTLSSNREQIYLDEATKLILEMRLTETRNGIVRQISDKIDACENLWDASIYYKKNIEKYFKYDCLLSVLTWRGTRILKSLDLYYMIPSFHKEDDKIKKSKSARIDFSIENSLLVFNDINFDNPQPRHLKKVFEKHPEISKIYVAIASDSRSYEYFSEHYNLDKYAPKKLSSYLKTFNVKPEVTAEKLIIYKYSLNEKYKGKYSYQSEPVGFTQVPIKNVEDSESNQVYSQMVGAKFIKFNDKAIDSGVLSKILKLHPSYNFYSLSNSKKKIEKFSKMENFEDFIARVVLNDPSIDFKKMRCMTNAYSKILSLGISRSYAKFSDKLPEESKFKTIFNKFNEIHIEYNKYKNIYNIYLSLYGNESDYVFGTFDYADEEKYDIVKMQKVLQEQYPLLDCINTDTVIENPSKIIDYITMCDRQEK